MGPTWAQHSTKIGSTQFQMAKHCLNTGFKSVPLYTNIDLSMPISQDLKLFEGKTTHPKGMFSKKQQRRVFVYACHVDACAKPRSNLCSVFIGPILCRVGCVSRKSQIEHLWVDCWYLRSLLCKVCAGRMRRVL